MHLCLSLSVVHLQCKVGGEGVGAVRGVPNNMKGFCALSFLKDETLQSSAPRSYARKRRYAAYYVD